MMVLEIKDYFLFKISLTSSARPVILS